MTPSPGSFPNEDAMKKLSKLVEHHLIYGLPGQRKRQNDLTLFISEGEHTAITDIQYSTPLNGRMMGWCLIFEGLKRIMRSDIESFNKKQGLSCTKKKAGKTSPRE